MKPIVLFLLTLLCGQMAFAQGADHINGGSFQKRIEYSTNSSLMIEDEQGNSYPAHILHNKKGLEDLFFGDMNAPVEYLFSPSYEDRRIPSGLRIVKSSSPDAPYTLEVKWITNWREVLSMLSEKYPSRGLTWEEMNSISKADQERITEQNREMHRKIEEERFDLYEVETLSLPVRDLGDSLYHKFFTLIDNFKAEGGAGMAFDGYSVMFRTVVGDEMWTLSIHIPQKRVLRMTNLCLRIIEDARAGEFDEGKYIRMFDLIEL